jgi:hypothetical protein
MYVMSSSSPGVDPSLKVSGSALSLGFLDNKGNIVTGSGSKNSSK